MSNENISENQGKQVAINELMEQGKRKENLTSDEITAMIDEGESDLEQIGRLYEDLEFLNAEAEESIAEQT
jgi:hypothetical protein